MVFDHVVKFDGRYYAAGEDVPINRLVESARSGTNAPGETAEKQAMEDAPKRGRPKRAE